MDKDAGEFGRILGSDDCGNKLHAINKGEESVIATSLARDGSNSGFAVGQEGLILKTTDKRPDPARSILSHTPMFLARQRGESHPRPLLGTYKRGRPTPPWLTCARAISEVVILGIPEMLRSSDDSAIFGNSSDVGIVRTWFQGIAAGVSATKVREKGFLRR